MVFYIFCSNATAAMGSRKEVDHMFSPKTLSDVGHPAVLQVIEDGERIEHDDREVHLVTVKQWKNGLVEYDDMSMFLPARVGKPGTVLKKDSLVVYYDLVHFKKDGEDRVFHKVSALYEEEDFGKGESDATATELSHLSKESLRERVGIVSLSDLKHGDMFVVTQTRPIQVGEGASKREDLLATVIRELGEDRSTKATYCEEEMILPARFKSQLKPDRLPLLGRYAGKKQTKCGNREYHDVHFMSGNDKRIQNVCLLQFRA